MLASEAAYLLPQQLLPTHRSTGVDATVFLPKSSRRTGARYGGTSYDPGMGWGLRQEDYEMFKDSLGYTRRHC